MHHMALLSDFFIIWSEAGPFPVVAAVLSRTKYDKEL